MFEMLLKSLGGAEGALRMFAGVAGLTPEKAQAHIDEFKNKITDIAARVKAVELNIAALAAQIQPLQRNDDNGEFAPDRSDFGPDRNPGCDGPNPGHTFCDDCAYPVACTGAGCCKPCGHAYACTCGD